MRTLLGLLIAWGLGWFLTGALGEPPEGDFYGTLRILPLVIYGLYWVSRQAERLGGSPRHRRFLVVELGFLGLTLVLIGGRQALGLYHLDVLLYTLLVLLLGLRIWFMIPTLRPALSKTLNSRPSILFFLLPLVVYTALAPWALDQRPPDGDEPFYLLVAHSLAYDFDASLSNNYDNEDSLQFMPRAIQPQMGDPRGADGTLYSRHNALFPLVLMVPYRLGGKVAVVFGMILLTALLAWWTLRLSRHYFPQSPNGALLAWALLAFTPPLILFSHQIWVEIPAAFLVVVILDMIRTARGRGYLGWRRALVMVAALVALPLLKMRFALLAAPLLGVAWWHLGLNRRRGNSYWRVLLGGTIILGIISAGLLAFNQWFYGNPLKIYTWEALEIHHRSWVEILGGFVGLFFDHAFGLFGACPLWILILAIPATWIRLPRKGEETTADQTTTLAGARGLTTDLLLATALYIALISSRMEWFGGWSPPFRYGLVILPLLAVGTIPLFEKRRGFFWRVGATALGVASLALGLLWTAAPGWTYAFATGGNRWLDQWTHTVRLDLGRLLPNATRTNEALWIAPLILIPLVLLAWKAPPRRIATRHAFSVGVSLAILLAGGWQWLGSSLPTRQIEMEDPWVGWEVGELFPDQWTPNRLRFRGARRLVAGDDLRIPVIPDGGLARVIVHYRFGSRSKVPYPLELWAGDQKLSVFDVKDDPKWQTESIEVNAGSSEIHELSIRPSPRPGKWRRAILIDRIDLEWRKGT